MDSTNHSRTVIEQETGPNVEVIAGLREVADFLEQHPDLPKLSGFIHGHVYNPDARGTLERVAELLGPDATERDSYGDVMIAREFSGGVDIELRASVKDVGGREVKVDYEPIIKREGAAA